MVGQNLLTTRQSTATLRIPPVAKVSPPTQQQQQGGVTTEDWQQSVTALQTQNHAPKGPKPLSKQLSKDLFPWLPEQKDTTLAHQQVLPQITRKPSPLKVSLSFLLITQVNYMHIHYQMLDLELVAVYIQSAHG